jgi:hypothetical protein
MICELDKDDYCCRHKTVHVGRLKELALEDSERGEAYRELWDRLLQTEAEPRKRDIGELRRCKCQSNKIFI